MNSSKLLIAAAATVSVLGAATFAFAQTTSPNPTQGQTGTMQPEAQVTTPATAPTTTGTTTPSTTVTPTDSSTTSADMPARADRN